MSPTSDDSEARSRQLANLKQGGSPAPPGHRRAEKHGAHTQFLVSELQPEIRELAEAIGGTVPVRGPDGDVPPADLVAVERAARALRRWRGVSEWLDENGRITKPQGRVRDAAELELRCERELAAALDSLGLTPASRAKLGVDLARVADLAQQWAGEDAIDGGATDDGR